jgi:hypothetical protein
MSQVTVTGKVGPNISITAGVFANVTQFDMNSDNNILTIWQGTKATAVSITSATTITVTVSGGQYTVSIS